MIKLPTRAWASPALGLLVATLVLTGCSSTGTTTTPPNIPALPAVPTSSAPAVEALGQTFTYPDGLAVTITKDSTFDPRPGYPNARGVTFAVKVTNGTSAPFAVSSITNGPHETVDGTTPSLIVNTKDSKAGAGSYESTVLPGKSFTYYSTIGLDTPSAEVQLEWKRDYTSPPAIFTSQV